MKILVVAAHPDDEILGVAGTLLKHKKQGDSLYILIMTAPYKPEYDEFYIMQKTEMQKQIDKILGVKKRFNLDFKTVNMNVIPHGVINKAVDEVVKEVDPDIIYTHWKHDVNYDHTITFRSCLVATRPPRHIKLVCFETLSETEWSDNSFNPNYWIDIKDFIDMKNNLFKIYRTEIMDTPHPRDRFGISNLAEKCGQDVCLDYAEAFMIIKEYWL